jgi:hypothetical protein
LNREIIHTLDGSTTIQIKEWDECYHSKHGAIQEAQHVFYKKWIVFISKQTNFNIGNWFWYGMNAFITFGRKKMNQSIDYVGWKLIRFRGRTGFHELRRRIECFESQGIF